MTLRAQRAVIPGTLSVAKGTRSLCQPNRIESRTRRLKGPSRCSG
jgi:hypothetical protein